MSYHCRFGDTNLFLSVHQVHRVRVAKLATELKDIERQIEQSSGIGSALRSVFSRSRTGVSLETLLQQYADTVHSLHVARFAAVKVRLLRVVCVSLVDTIDVACRVV